MSSKPEKSSSIQDGVSSVSAADLATTMRERIALLAGERQWSDTRESWLGRAARYSGIRYARIRAIWYGEVDRFWFDEVQIIEEAAAKRLEEIQEIGARNAAIRLAITRHHPPRENVRNAVALGAVAHEPGGEAERTALDGGNAAVRPKQP